MSDTLVVNEVYTSIQGESTFAGLPCIFIRLTGCNLRCSYCDTAYAFTEGKKQTLTDILTEVRRISATHTSITNQKLPLVELTGGEPLLQPNVHPLMKQLCDDGFTVLIETSGAHDISKVDSRVRRIMDLKCPSSGEADRNLWSNVSELQETDEVKFVIGTEQDYEWAKSKLTEHSLSSVCPVLFSWVAPLKPEQHDKSLKPFPSDHTPISREQLVDRVIADALPVRFQLQMHKFIWAPEERGV